MRHTEPLEFEIQAAFTRWLLWNRSRHPALRAAFHIPNGAQANQMGGRSKKYRATAVAKLRAVGQRDGVSDYFIPLPHGPYHGIFLEFKRPNGKPTELQRDFMMRVRDLGYRAFVVYSLDAAIEKVENALKDITDGVTDGK